MILEVLLTTSVLSYVWTVNVNQVYNVFGISDIYYED